MKRKFIMLMVVCCGMLAISACSLKPKEVVLQSTEADKTEEQVEANADPEEEKQVETETKKDYPVLDGEAVEGYEGFVYLYEEVLMTESKQNDDTGKMESTKQTIYIPQGEYNNVDRDYAYAESLGVFFTVDMDPYFNERPDDYLMSENLELYLEDRYDPFYDNEKKDLVINVEDINEDTARAVVEYCSYDEWGDSYSTVFQTYLAKKLKSGAYILVDAEINTLRATGKTPMLIEELEKFYEYDIEWNPERAAKKQEDYIAGGGDRIFSTNYMVFELPEGWKRDVDADAASYNTKIFAPGGDAEAAGCLISFTNQDLDSSSEFTINDLINNEDLLAEFMKQMLGENVPDIEIEKVEDTCMGDAIKLSFELSDGTSSVKDVMYMMKDTYSLYMIQAMLVDGAEGDPFTVAEDILMNAQTNPY